MTRFPAMIAVLGLSMMPFATFASDNSLYAEAAPDDASFLRFVGFADAPQASFAGKTFTLNADDRDAYIPVSSAKLTGVTPGSYLTIIRQPSGSATAIAEAPRPNRSKIALVLVNATDQPLDLRLADGSVAVLDNVAPMSSDLRPVNPVQLALGVFAEDGTTPLATFDVAMKRGQNLTFLADADGIRLIEHRFAAVAD